MEMICSIDNSTQFDVFNEATSTVFMGLNYDRCITTENTRSKFWARSIDSLILTSIKSLGSGTMSARRDRHAIAAETDDYMLMMVAQAGTIWNHQFGREVAINQGQLILVDSHENYEVRYTNTAKCFVVRIPARLMREAVGPPDRYCGFAIDARGGRNALLSDYLFSAWRHAPTYSEHDKPTVSGGLVDAIAAICNSISRPEVSRHIASARHFDRARRYIETQLRDPDLTPTKIANALCISIGHLHAIMRANGNSAGKLMLALRLDRCRDALADPELRGYTITHIAHHWGFTDSAHFAKAFKARFGITPRDYRN